MAQEPSRLSSSLDPLRQNPHATQDISVGRPAEERGVLTQPTAAIRPSAIESAAARSRSGDARGRACQIPRQSATKLPLRVDGQVPLFLRLSELRRDHPALAGQVRILRRVEHHHRGSRRAGRRRSCGAARRRRSAFRPRGPHGRLEVRAPCRHGDRRARSGRRRRLRARVGDADRRRAGHRQIHPADPGLRGGGAVGRARDLRLRRGIDGPGAAARRPARTCRAPVQVAAQTLVEDIVATLASGDAPKFVVIEFDPDDVERRHRIRAGHGEPGAGLGPGADPLRQGERRGAARRRPCHQGRPDRGSPRRGAHGRRGLLVRGRRRARVSPAESRQEPLRRDRRGRRLRDDRRGARRGAESRRLCSWPGAMAPPARALRCSPASRARGRSWSRFRPWSRRPRWARRVARLSAGSRAGSPWCWRCSKRTAG